MTSALAFALVASLLHTAGTDVISTSVEQSEVLRLHLGAERFSVVEEDPPKPQTPPSQSTAASTADEEKPSDDGSEPVPPDALSVGEDACKSLAVTGRKWIDRMNRGLHRAVCESALWFDNLFGDPRIREDRESTYGRLLLGLHYDEREGFEDFTNFQAKLNLPKMERRLNAFVGRGDREQIVTGQNPVEDYVPPVGLDDDEWLVGLGYSPARGRRSKTSFDVGVDVDFPMNPFVRARYRHRFFPGNRTLVRVRPSIFWEREEGGGSTTKIDVDHLIGREMLFRWRNVGTWTEESEGLEWYVELTLFQNLGLKRALAYQLGSFGEGDHPVPVREHFVRLIYRQQVFREWLFLDVRPGFGFRREEPMDSRDVVPFLSFGFEMMFGDRPGRRGP